ncbi:MAG: alkaline phosphatase family protein, partial [Elusimicrobia bacterium]|nr:alkaline phosphatase family protein [Elusimicrobiota bacterium]
MPLRTRIMPVFFLFLFASAADAAVRLGAVVVVDQMRPEYLDRSDLPDGGFRRLRREGAVFTSARHLHIPTETAPGHAAISTGRSPAVHGIVANDWFDRTAGSETYCMADAAFGLGPEHLRGPTLADALKASEPGARVFAVSG